MRTQRGSFFCLNGFWQDRMSKKYTKPALPLDNQADLLFSRGLTGITKEKLIKILSTINYYRLRGYTYPYQDNSRSDSPFLSGSCWSYILNDYMFDLQLRTLLFEAIGQIEIAFRTQLELCLSLAYDSHWYENRSLFHNDGRLTQDLKELQGHWDRSREIFKEHYESEYDTSVMPPSWMIFETTTFGIVSKFFSNLERNIPAKSQVSAFLGFTKSSTKVFISWMQHINLVRNICAHHSRLFSRSFIRAEGLIPRPLGRMKGIKS
jgi:abortive infection bacteriophage resistance protein